MDTVKIDNKVFVLPDVYREKKGLKSLKTVYNRINRGELETKYYLAEC